jgi:hypothetical protein
MMRTSQMINKKTKKRNDKRRKELKGLPLFYLKMAGLQSSWLRKRKFQKKKRIKG